ncbi:hypothetical protein SCH01S_33_00110 [Sphingomonas changbaiensis NBRC 104936]|uniref:DUF3489 domain-containing protein n=1 Tax=Sphingomonas changbaiensis NBRC 104936 TaxID=1219043 RepID=A0A0E9MPQ1_9SPHN|nr:DUF3489 domain-containing protein [Sphingomonas changbaiensis]GAO39524.1 hypothetical protein SCH01S_33_00110 [Sphingomonas changbaiensis NBRC 104936]
MTKLTDIQAILLSSAAARASGHLLPLPESLAGKDEPAHKAIRELIKRGLAAEVETTGAATILREGGGLHVGAVITDAGKHAIGAVEPDGSAPNSAMSAAEPTKARSDTKQAKVLELLRREQGASIEELMQATGWLPHTTRAALTGIRKRGVTLDKNKVDGVTRYTAAAAQ